MLIYMSLHYRSLYVGPIDRKVTLKEIYKNACPISSYSYSIEILPLGLLPLYSFIDLKLTIKKKSLLTSNFILYYLTERVKFLTESTFSRIFNRISSLNKEADNKTMKNVPKRIPKTIEVILKISEH